MIGNSPEFTTLLKTVTAAAARDVSVLLLGESGTGKELLARHLHQHSHRHQQPFVAINCASLPDALIESELFGHRKGAFTGAVEHHQGTIATAHGGTLFLDEVAEMSLSTQARLLRFLESGEYRRVGDNRLLQADIRLIAATHDDLAQRVKQGGFRADLYYRLNVMPFVIPPLRHRPGDITILIDGLLQQLSAQHQLPVCRFDTTSQRLLDVYPWPGNVRELRNFCERMLILYPGQVIHPQLLPQEIHPHDNSLSAQTPGFTLPQSGIHLVELEKDLLRQALRHSRGNRSKAARLLGLTRDTFLYRLKKYAISDAGIAQTASVTM